MTNKDKKHRRWLHSTGRKVLKVEKVKIKNNPILFIPSLCYFSWMDRFKSLLNFKKEELPSKVLYKNRQLLLAKSK
jgi:hypothetical protein